MVTERREMTLLNASFDPHFAPSRQRRLLRQRQFLRRLAAAGVLGLALLAGGCAEMAPPPRQPAPVRLWPAPPETPRIAYVGSVSRASDLGIERGFFASLIDYLAGRADTPLVNPHGLTVDAEERLYVVDSFRRRVHVFDRRAGSYRLFPETSTELVSPIGIAIDERRGRIYVTDSAQAVIRIYDRDSLAPAGEIRGGDLGRPTGIAINPSADELLVADTTRAGIVRYRLADHRVAGVVGREGSADGEFHSPTHVAVAPDGRLLVTDALNFRVQTFAATGSFVNNFGAAGDSPGYFSRPKGVAVDSEGHVYVVDALFDNIQVFDREGRLLLAFGETGAEAGEFWLPAGIWIDAHDRIYVADSYNRRVQIFQYLKEGELP